MGAEFFRVVVMGCSTGGLHALQTVLPKLRPDLPAPVILVCHTGSESVDLLIHLLSQNSALPVAEASERTAPEPGVVYVAPSGYHLYLEADRRFSLSIDPKVCFVRPSIDVLFESAALSMGSGVAAVLMTGANDDGASGVKTVRACNGIAIVQDPEEAVAPEMPRAALKLAGADHVCRLAQIASLLNEWCQ